MKYIKEYLSHNDDFEERIQIVGSDAIMCFVFDKKKIYDHKEILENISIYNKTFIESKEWSGGPVNNEFIKYFSEKYNEKIRSHPFKPCVSLDIQTEDGIVSMQFSMKKNIYGLNWEKLRNEKLRKWVYDNFMVKNLTLDQTIRKLNLNVIDRVDWNWIKSKYE